MTWLHHVILADLGRHPLEALDAETLAVWWGRMLGRYKPATANKYLTELKKVLNRAVEWGYLGQSPARFLKKAREGRGRVRFFTDEQRAKLLAAAGPRLRLYLLAARYTGQRRRSLLDLREGDVDLGRDEVTFRDTKNGEDLTLPLHPKLREVVEPLLTGDPERRLLPEYRDGRSLSRAFKRLARRVLGPQTDFRWHDTRHDVGASLAMSGASTRLIMDVPGHKDPKMSLRYQHLTRDNVRRWKRSRAGSTRV